MDAADAYRHIRKDREANLPKKPEASADAYFSLRRAIGFTTHNLKKHLRSLLCFMDINGLSSFEQIDRNLAAMWLYSGSPQEKTIAGRLGTMRGFFRYLLSFGIIVENVWETYPTPKQKLFIPYIFTVEELSRLFNYLRGQIPLGRLCESRVRCAHFTMFHTVYACGLRAQEICNLKIGDVDFERSFFIIKNTKFHKTRIVPFNSRTRQLILEYLNQFRRADDGLRPDAPLLINFWKRAFSKWSISRYFNQVCKATGIYRPKRVKDNTVFGGTTLHCLRHSFAVHRLLKWYKEGADVNAKLPLLSTYMGHSSYHYTQRYLTVLPVFIDMAGKMFADKFETPLKDLECPHNP